jgi:hypothetical protein
MPSMPLGRIQGMEGMFSLRVPGCPIPARG